jgi:hypothetical protein
MIKKHNEYMWKYRTNGASLIISRAYRGYVIRTRLHTLIYWNRMKLAIRIQRVYRGYKIRKVFKKAILNRRRLIAKREKAAIRLQSYIRMYLSRKHYLKHKEMKIKQIKDRRKKKKKLLKDKVTNTHTIPHT